MWEIPTRPAVGRLRAANVTTTDRSSPMSTEAGFRPVGEVVADERGRVTVARAGGSKNDRYAIAVNADGEILLTPLASIPRRELVVWQDEQLRESLARGLAQSAAGQTVDLGDFQQYADADVD
jgi:PHD/YefM family antitoxin component YafN of YafNO toxin-antitoxin module